MIVPRRPNGWRTLAVLGVMLGAAAILLTAWLYARSVDAREQIAAEGEERRHQTCVLFERDYISDVAQIRRTHAYLDRLPRQEWGTNLTITIVRGLPDLYAEARSDQAPAFCDKPGVAGERRGEPPVGLPEPNPELPPERDFSRLLERP